MASACACCTVRSLVRRRTNPGLTLEGGKFAIEAVGEEPTSPLTTVPAPVEPVTPELPNTEKLAAAPRGGAVWANGGNGQQSMPRKPPKKPRRLKYVLFIPDPPSDSCDTRVAILELR